MKLDKWKEAVNVICIECGCRFSVDRSFWKTEKKLHCWCPACGTMCFVREEDEK